MKKANVLFVLACSSLALIACGEQSQASSSSASSSAPASSQAASSAAASSEHSDSSQEVSSSAQQEKEERVLTITPTNLEGVSFIQKEGVAPNASYTTEFTFAKSVNSFMASRAIEGITKIVATVYGNYDNLVMYDAVEGGNVVESVSEANGAYQSAKDYTYAFSGTNEWRLTNPSSYDVHLYSLSIYYTGEINAETPFIEEDGKIDINAQTYAKHSKLASEGITVEGETMVFAPAAYVKATGLGKVSSLEMKSGSLSFSVYALDGETKTKVQPSAGASDESASYDMGEADGFLIVNETSESLSAKSFAVAYDDAPDVETQEVTIAEAQTIALGLSRVRGTSTSFYKIKGTVGEKSGSTVTLSDGEDSIVCYSATDVENMNPKYQVTVYGQLQNYYGKPEIVNYSVVEYVPATYSVTATASENGTFTLSKTEGIAYGEEITITCQPNEGYEAKKALVGGKALKISGNVVNAAITDDCAISVTFEEISEEKSNETTADYVISDYEKGSQFAEETHTLDDNTSVEIQNCYWTSELRIYSSTKYNGTAIVHSQGVIKSLTMNLGNAADTLNVYGSEDGEEYTLIAALSVVSAYGDFEVAMPEGSLYHDIKLDVEGTNAIWMKSFSLTYEPDAEGFVIHSLEMNGTYGDANLIQYGDYDILVDSGTASDADNVREMLKDYVTDGTLDLVIVSHPDSDHYAGITSGCLDAVDHISTIITNNHHSDTANIISAAQAVDPNVVSLTASDVATDAATPYTIDVDALFSIDIMYNPGYAGSGKNNASIPALFTYKNTKLFMAGDLEESGCNAFMSLYPDLFEADDYVIFKGLHHGSNGSNKTNFLEYVQPDMAFVNAPLKTSEPNNTPNYGTHPYLEAMERIGEVTPNLYWAGICGTLTIECDGYSSTVFGDGRTRDYYYYNKNDGSYTKVSREDETDITFFESMWYKQAIENLGAEDYAHKWSE